MFFPESNKVDEECLVWANTLYDCVRKHTTKYLSRRYIPRWARCFARLKKEFTATTVDKVLHWYTANFGGEFLPVATTGESFYQKFDAIHKYMFETSLEECPEMPVEVDHLLTEYRYPPEIASRLPTLCVLSRREWVTFCEKMLDHRCLNREADFINRILAMYSPTFVVDWLVFLSHKYGTMENYRFPALKLAFKPKSLVFRDSFWHKWSYEWCGCTTAFDPLLAELQR